MKLVGALLTLLIALMVEIVAGYFSVVGLAALFAAAFWPVVVMGGTLEAGKLVAATWLKQNWKNSNVAWLHKLYLLVAIGSLMAITSLGIYGYLAKAHLEQEANLPAVEIQIKQMEARISQADAERVRQEARLGQLDQSVGVMLANSKTAKDARSANLARDSQRKDRLDIQRQIASLNKEVNTLNETLVPLRLKVSDVSAKLGPVKYVASLFGWKDANSAVQLIILLIMIAFDPLAVVMVLSGTLSLSEAIKEMAERRERRTRAKLESEKIGDLDYFTQKTSVSLPIPPEYYGLAAETVAPKVAPAVEPDPLGVMPSRTVRPDRPRTPLVRYRAPVPPGSPSRPVMAPSVPVEVPAAPAPVEAFSPVTADTVADEPEKNPLDANTALFEAVNAEIEKLQPRPIELENKDKLTVAPKIENMTGIEAADFNSFSDNHIQKNK